MYWWVVAWGRPGTKLDMKRALFGPFTTESGAQLFADRLDGRHEVLELSTRNPGKATQMLKAKGVEVASGKEWENQFSRVRHPKVK